MAGVGQPARVGPVIERRLYRTLTPGLLDAVPRRIAARIIDAEVSARVGVLVVLAATATPLLAIGSTLMTIDPLSIFFWMAAMFTFWVALERAEKDRLGDVLGLRARRGETHRNQFTHITNLIGRQNRLGRGLESLERRRRDDRLHSDQISRRENGMAEIVRNMDGAKTRVSDGAAHESDLARSGEAKVGDILSAPMEETVVLFSKNRSSDSVFRHQRGSVGQSYNRGKYCEAIFSTIATPNSRDRNVAVPISDVELSVASARSSDSK